MCVEINMQIHIAGLSIPQRLTGTIIQAPVTSESNPVFGGRRNE